jgi:aminopeptidase N
MVANVSLTKNLRLANRSAEFPGLLQALPKHTALSETLAITILTYVQRMAVTPAERKAEYVTRLTARLAERQEDATLAGSIIAIAEDLDLFANEPTP